MNARVGLEQVLPEEVGDLAGISRYRRSNDARVCAKGKKFLSLCADQELVLLNGRTRGDDRGQNTYLSKVGSSVIDLACVSIECLVAVKDFRVDRQLFSDHQPIVVTLAQDSEHSSQEAVVEPLMPKLMWNDEYKIKYCQGIEAKLPQLESRPQEEMAVQQRLDQLIKLIKEVAQTFKEPGGHKPWDNKEKWFDGECFRVRKKCFALLNLCRRTGSSIIRKKYADMITHYKSVCENKKKAYNNEVVEKVAKAKDSKEFWQAAKALQKNRTTNRALVPADEFKEHFDRHLNVAQHSAPHQFAQPFIEIEQLDKPFTMQELKRVLVKAKCNKAPGMDRVPMEFFKNAPETLLVELLGLFNRILRDEEVPKSFTRAILFPILKKGDPADVVNYRGISFMDAVSKLFVGLLADRLMDWVQQNDILTEAQAGFRPNYSTCDNIFSLMNIASIQFAKKRKLYLFFVDFKAAFDSLARDAIFYKLHNAGVSNKFVNVLRGLYRETAASIWTKEGLSAEFEVRMGVKQGCLASPLIFSLFLNDIGDCLEGGIDIAGRNINMLLYADDLVMMADSKRALQKMIDKLESYCEEWNLTINTEKSKIMVCRRGGGRLAKKEVWFYKGEKLEIVKSYKYLGITLTPSMSLNEHMNDRLLAAKFAIVSVWSGIFNKNKVPFRVKMQIFLAVSRTVLSYGAQAWGYQRFGQLEKLLKFFVKKACRLPMNAPDYFVYRELGLEKMFLHTMKLHLDYLGRVSSMDKNRLPGHTAREVCRLRCGWFQEWTNAWERFFGAGSRLGGIEEIVQRGGELLQRIRVAENNAVAEAAKNSAHHLLYAALDHDKNNYIEAEDGWFVSNIMRARGELLNLNFVAGRRDRDFNCSMCNMAERENTEHFLARCPILAEFRVRHLGKAFLSTPEIVDVLNGEGWEGLNLYMREASRYRKMLIEEFNYC
ncbi:Reverse transcriptase (RNA-dependent DNA polymerase) [Nesidiocoris tenuis]|uniref:Reverse transcriptase (RNA-dependent DNA polymerase) n=1 Tax=Nesidiocoris tenuis TaxID=355587 RepID=A0ABN7AKM6_9HEMI|nr:Reverse transcriptase (RNA-dependent DNA polymerase) [Nesidiocoris tenuis]